MKNLEKRKVRSHINKVRYIKCAHFFAENKVRFARAEQLCCNVKAKILGF